MRDRVHWAFLPQPEGPRRLLPLVAFQQIGDGAPHRLRPGNAFPPAEPAKGLQLGPGKFDDRPQGVII